MQNTFINFSIYATKPDGARCAKEGRLPFTSSAASNVAEDTERFKYLHTRSSVGQATPAEKAELAAISGRLTQAAQTVSPTASVLNAVVAHLVGTGEFSETDSNGRYVINRSRLSVTQVDGEYWVTGSANWG